MKQDDLKKFLEKTPASEKKQRSIHGKMMDYVDARYVADRLDQICGPSDWKSTVRQADFKSPGYAFITTIEIWIDELEQWVGREDGGAQDEIQDRSGNKVSPENDFKGALSDSFKRAAVQWGIARDLYQPEKYADTIDLDQPSTMPASTPHSGGVRTSEFPPTAPTEPIQSPLLSDDGQVSDEDVWVLKKLHSSLFPWVAGKPPTDPRATEFYHWMQENNWSLGSYKNKQLTGVNVPQSSYEKILSVLEGYKVENETDEPF